MEDGMQDSSPYLGATLSRRRFLAGSAAALATTAAGVWLPLGAEAAESSIHELRGDVLVNGRRIDRNATVRAGDSVVTTSSGYVVFVVGSDAFMLRERSEVRLEPASGQAALIAGLRLLTGAIGAVFGRRPAGRVNIVAATVTAGIRGTGVYLETRGEGTYFCSCYGTVDLQANANTSDRETIEASRHNNPRMILNQPRDGQLFVPAPFQTHTDAEMDMLEKCVGRRAPWAQGR
jgi:hypothetical protein